MWNTADIVSISKEKYILHCGLQFYVKYFFFRQRKAVNFDNIFACVFPLPLLIHDVLFGVMVRWYGACTFSLGKNAKLKIHSQFEYPSLKSCKNSHCFQATLN